MPKLSRGQRLSALLVPPLVVLCLAILLFDAIGRRRASTELVERTHDRLARVEWLRSRLVDAEAGQRSFLVTGEEADLAPYRGAARDVWTALGELRGDKAGDPPQLARIQTLERVVEQRLARLEEGIAIRRTQGLGEARAYVMHGAGGPLMQRVRQLLDEVKQEEERLLAARNGREEAHARLVLWILGLGSLAAILTALVTHRLFAGYTREVEALNHDLGEKNQQLGDQALELEMQAEELQIQAAQLEETLAELEVANEELQAQRSHLEEMAAELEASNDELITANHTLEERTAQALDANRAKSEFLATMSHELRTPLNAIAGYTELLQMGIHGPVTEAQATALHRVARNQKYLLSLINDVLNFAKLEAGKIEVRVADVAVAETVAGLEDVVLPQLRAKGLRYQCDPCDAALRMRGDRERVEQILVNLLTNAIKFTDAGGRVELRAEAPDDRVRILVRDTGCGIPAHKLEEIFDPFVQVQRDGARSGQQQGVGLGLAISRELAQSMGGDLTVESQEGVGSTFTLTLLQGRRITTGSIFTGAPEVSPAAPAGPRQPAVGEGD
jgi:signal transduction histidine kinase